MARVLGYASFVLGQFGERSVRHCRSHNQDQRPPFVLFRLDFRSDLRSFIPYVFDMSAP